jgi:hypothetical protein
MFGGPVMSQFVTINSAIAVFWVALAAGYQLGFEGFSILLFAVFIEIVWIDVSSIWQHRRRD